jgi:hypothetical protein
MNAPPVDQAWLDQQVDEAIAPYADKLAPAELAWMREQLAERLKSDPALGLLAHRAQPRVVDESGEIFYPRKDEPEGAARVGDSSDADGVKETG